MYSVLDVRTVDFKDHENKRQEVNLIRLQNPWNDGVEWNGRCSDMDKFWTDEVKEKFIQAYDDMRTDAGNARFMHSWYQDDGIFCMRVEDFLEYFTQIVVCRDFTEQFFGVEYD